MKKYLFLALIFIGVIVKTAVSQEAKDLPRLYWGMYHSDIDNDYLSKTSITRWAKASVPFRIITTENAQEQTVLNITMEISKPKSVKKTFRNEGNTISEEMKQALLNVSSGDMVLITAYFTHNGKPANKQLIFAVE